MTDIERRLRAAMAASAQPPPPGLLDGIRWRHRRHHRRVAVACAAVVAFGVAGTLVTRGVLAGQGGAGPGGTGPAASGPAIISSARPSSTATPAPGTVLLDCQSNVTGGTLGKGWKAQSVHAGPVWFIYARPRGSTSPGHGLRVGKMTASAMAIAVENGHTAVVRAAPELGGRFRFLAGFHGDGHPYTLAEGAPGLTLAGCPAEPAGTRIPEIYAPGLTMFWEGYVTDLRGCIPLEVRASPAGQPARVTVGATYGGCGR